MIVPRWSNLALAVASSAVGVALAVALLHPSRGFEVAPGAVPELSSYFGVWDSTGQRRAQKLLLVLIALAVVAGPLLRRLPVRVPDAALGVLAAGACGWAAWAAFAWGSPVAVLGAAVGGVIVALGAAGRLPPATPGLVRAIAVVVLVVLYLPGLVGTVDASHVPPDVLAEIEFHYSMITEPGRKLAHGFPIFDEVKAGYGLVMPLVMAVVEGAVGPLRAVTYSRLVAASQLGFALAVGALLVRRAGGRWERALVPGLLLGAAFNAFTPAMWQPNLAGWRFGGLALALWAIELADRVRGPGGDARSRLRVGLWLGSAAGAALVFNFETGVAALIAALAWAWLREGGARWPLRPALAIGAGVLAGASLAVVAFLALWRVVLGHALEPFHPNGMLSDVLLFAGGYCGLPFTPLPLALFATVHAAYVLVRLGLQADRPLAHRPAFRGAVAAALLVWLAYLANRPHPYNLAVFAVLWGFLLVDALPLARRATLAGRLTAATVALVVAPYLATELGTSLVRAVDAVRPGPIRPDAELVSGVWVEPAAAEALRRKADRVRREGEGGRVWYVTAHSWLVAALSDTYPPLPVANAFSDVTLEVVYDRVIGAIRDARPPRVLFDDDDPALRPSPEAIALFARMRSDLADLYEPVATEDGWIVLALRPAEAAAR